MISRAAIMNDILVDELDISANHFSSLAHVFYE